jgi:hypothetical protein
MLAARSNHPNILSEDTTLHRVILRKTSPFPSSGASEIQMTLRHLFVALLGLTFISMVLSHRNHNLYEEKEIRRRYLNGLQGRALDHCTAKLKKSGVEGKIIARRQALATELREKHLQKHHGGQKPIALLKVNSNFRQRNTSRCDKHLHTYPKATKAMLRSRYNLQIG